MTRDEFVALVANALADAVQEHECYCPPCREEMERTITARLYPRWAAIEDVVREVVLEGHCGYCEVMRPTRGCRCNVEMAEAALAQETKP